jgi:hypothetical protein
MKTTQHEHCDLAMKIAKEIAVVFPMIEQFVAKP